MLFDFARLGGRENLAVDGDVEYGCHWIAERVTMAGPRAGSTAAAQNCVPTLNVKMV